MAKVKQNKTKKQQKKPQIKTSEKKREWSWHTIVNLLHPE